ncbi:hypothetical protein BOTBODRAFT_348647 [Botryobasidium botryosum FD-172 SS1]|uniref:Uncharacterized protein n=1 Tax=Botryobasidium botryosum (strain FD-172 SS1) TaxID=930990 RepID=A0A067MRY9_BOTB1|nr:hypothetical protein BOTBODRAFT_348647 [Botryobasidium botryosum FD-172 SS1]
MIEGTWAGSLDFRLRHVFLPVWVCGVALHLNLLLFLYVAYWGCPELTDSVLHCESSVFSLLANANQTAPIHSSEHEADQCYAPSLMSPPCACMPSRLLEPLPFHSSFRMHGTSLMRGRGLVLKLPSAHFVKNLGG